MIDAILGLFGLGRLYLAVTLDGEPVDADTQLCLVREGATEFKMERESLIAAIRGAPMVDTRLPGLHAMLDTRGRWDGALLRPGNYRALVRFNKVGLVAGRMVAAEYCFELEGEPIKIIAGQKTHRSADTRRVPLGS